MIRKLPSCWIPISNYQSTRSFLTILFVCLMGPLGHCLWAQTSQEKEFGPSTLALSYDFNACRSFGGDNSPYEYHEFTSELGESCTAISSGHLYRHSGKHSCTDDAQGNPGDAACFQSSLDAYYSPNHTLAIRFDVNLQGLSDRSSRLDGIRFQQSAPYNYIWSAAGLEPTSGPNNYPTKYGIRVLKDGQVIYNESDRATAQYWRTETLDFSSNPLFQVSPGQTSIFTFELTSYAPIGNGAAVSVWDLDNLTVSTSCETGHEVNCSLTVDAGQDHYLCENESITLSAIASGEQVCKTVTSSYKITDANTEGKECFPTAGTGVIYQLGSGCQGVHHIWRAGTDLMLQEFSDNTARMTGSVIDQNGVIGIVDIALGEKAGNGVTWPAPCYQAGIDPDPRTFYKSFNGTITVNGEPLSVLVKSYEQHYILANGAGFEPGQFGIGGWTGGTFGGCTEWFGNLEPMPVDTSEKKLSYLWSTGETTPTITVNESGSYTVTVTDCEDCTATDTVKVYMNTVTADAGEDQTICKGDSVTLSVTGAGTYLWSTGETSRSITVSPETDTIYSVTVTNGSCEATDSVEVFVRDITAEAGEDRTICKGDSVTLSVTGAGTYLWSTGETSRSITVSPETDTTYSVTVTNGSCEATDSVEVFVRDITAEAGEDRTICKGDSVTLSVTGEGTYLWSTGETSRSITVSPETDTTYSVTVTNGSCEASDSIKVFVGEAIAEVCEDQTICKGDSVVLSVEGQGTYLWSTGETTQFITVAPQTDTTYSVTVTNGSCNATDTVKVTVDSLAVAVSADQTICKGETVTLSVMGEGSYLWSTGETSPSIKVAPEVDTRYSVSVTQGACQITKEIWVTVEDKLIIGDYVWLDKNQNGLQDDGSTGLNNISVYLYQCSGELMDMTTTTSDRNGEAGYYQFEVCANSGDYYIAFGAVPAGFEFTDRLTGDNNELDSNADEDGRTNCFTITGKNDLSIDAGLSEVCRITVDAGTAKPICRNSGHIVELTATVQDASPGCEGGCVYPILEQERCFGPTGTFEIWLASNGGTSAKFTASEQRFERLPSGDARYTAKASNGVDAIEVDVTFTGYTKTPVLGSPKLNGCQDYDTSEWEYWTTWNGTIISEDHGVFTVSMLGAPFQMGIGADVVRTGFGASGWFSANGGDGYYTTGDINIPLAECQENGVEYKWTTTDGHIVGDPYKKTIQVDQPGTYVFEALNCIDCYTSDKVVIKEVDCNKGSTYNSTKISNIYPVPVDTGGRLTIEFGSSTAELTGKKAYGPQLKEDVKVTVYDINGRLISVPRFFEVTNGKAIIHLDIDSVPSGKYIVRAQGNYWAESKQFLVK